MDPIVLPGWLVAVCAWTTLALLALSAFVSTLWLTLKLFEHALRLMRLHTACFSFVVSHLQGYRLVGDEWVREDTKIKRRDERVVKAPLPPTEREG